LASRSKRKRVDPRILEHELVPEHRILPLEEAVRVLRMLGVPPNKLPRISINDPVAQLLGAKPGDIIEIRRKSETAGEAVYYRIVVVF